MVGWVGVWGGAHLAQGALMSAATEREDRMSEKPPLKSKPVKPNLAKPKWAVERDRARRAGAGPETIWLFGLHAVRDALVNPRRKRHRLIVTPNAATKLAEAIDASGIEPEIADPRKFTVPLDPQSVHQGAALEAEPLDWGGLDVLSAPRLAPRPAPRPAARTKPARHPSSSCSTG